MDTIDKQKALADRVERVLKAEGVNPLLAGGAPRDWNRGVEANDLDFYIKSDDAEDSAVKVSTLLDIELFNKGDEKYESFIEYNDELLAVYEGDFHDEIVQFMFVSIDPMEFVTKKFDLSICKVWYENGEIGMDWEARLSFREGVIVGGAKQGRLEKIMGRGEWTGFRWLHSWRRALDWMEEELIEF